MIALAAGLVNHGSAALAEISVVTSIKPVDALVSGVMQGIGKPHLIVRGDASPHVYALKPSDARSLQQAAIIFWIGPGLEQFLKKPLLTLAPNANQVALASGEHVNRLPLREGGPFEMHEEHSEDDHGDGEFDMHVWLDPVNAKAIVRDIERTLVTADPKNASAYSANANDLLMQLDILHDDIEVMLSPVRDRPFIVFHDAYHHFENRFGLKAAGSIIVNPDAMPGAGRLSQIQARIRQLGAVCVFAEPQFNRRLIKTATDGTDARSAILDPVGADLPEGPDLYFTLMRNLAGSIRDCLSQPG
jgi:zinc transport system substrate-binding protein